MSEDFILRQNAAQLDMEWKIKNFFSLPKEKIYSLDSPVFSFLDTKWYLRIYFRIDSDETFVFGDAVDRVSLYLVRKSSSSKKHSIETIFRIQQRDGSFCQEFSETLEFQNLDEEKGCQRFMKASDLRDKKDTLTTLDGSLIVVCIVRVSSHHILYENAVETACQTSSSENLEILQGHFKDLFVNERQGDVLFNIEDQEIKAHQLILSARSPVFFAMFAHDTEEKKTGVVNITDCDPESFKTFLSFLYSGEANLVSSNNAVVLYKIAHKYNLKDLMNECVRCVKGVLSVDTFYAAILLATLHNDSKLLENATDFFVKNAETILTTSKWQLLLHEYPTVANELFIQMANKKWHNCDCENNGFKDKVDCEVDTCSDIGTNP